MSSIVHHLDLGIRVRADNPNHHLWNNHGTWFLHYTVHPTPFTKDRVRRSLATNDLEVARERRDTFFRQAEGSASRTSQTSRRLTSCLPGTFKGGLSF